MAPDDIKLKGVFVSSSPAHSRALIVDGDSKEESYRIGESLPGGGIIKKINDTYIILLLNGELLHLLLNPEEPTEQPSSIKKSTRSFPKGYR